MLGAVLVGGVLQRVSGMGMGLVLAPVLSILMGPALGVTVTNTATLISATLIGFVLRHDIDWRRLGSIAAAAVFGSVPGAFMVKHLDSAWLSVFVGGAVLVALLTTVLTGKLRGLPHVTGLGWLIPFAMVGAFLNTTAGVAAPAFVIYSLMARWGQRSFAATLQPTFAILALLSIGSKVITGATTIEQLPHPWLMVAVFAVVVIAISIGTILSRRVSAAQARSIAIVVAGLGAASALIRGLIGALS